MHTTALPRGMLHICAYVHVSTYGTYILAGLSILAYDIHLVPPLGSYPPVYSCPSAGPIPLLFLS
jgi:hypothetical protein